MYLEIVEYGKGKKVTSQTACVELKKSVSTISILSINLLDREIVFSDSPYKKKRR